MSESTSDTKIIRRRGRPYGSRTKHGRGIGLQVNVRLHSNLLQLLDDWRRSQPDLPSRQEAIKRLIEATAED